MRHRADTQDKSPLVSRGAPNPPFTQQPGGVCQRGVGAGVVGEWAWWELRRRKKMKRVSGDVHIAALILAPDSYRAPRYHTYDKVLHPLAVKWARRCRARDGGRPGTGDQHTLISAIEFRVAKKAGKGER